MVDDRLDLSGHAGRVVDVGEELVQLLFPLHAPDGQHPVVLGLKSVGGGTVGDEPAGKALHGDKAHVGGLTLVDQFQLLLTGNVAERELQRLIQAAVNGLVGHRQPMVRDADVPDHALGFGLLHGLVQAAAVTGLRAEGRVVELIQVDVIGAQIGQGSVQVLPEVLCILRRRLGGDVHLRADAVKGLAQLDLAVGVGAGGIKKADACLVSLAGQIDGIFLRDALDGQCAEAIFVHRDAGAAKGDHIHSCFLHPG